MFKNRIAAGERLAEELITLNLDNPRLFAIPRGGIVTAFPIAKAFHQTIQVLVTRKIGHPANPEIAIGAVMPDGTAVWDERAVTALDIYPPQLETMLAHEYQEVQRRQQDYGQSAPPLPSGNTPVIIIDDGIATGYTVKAAIRWLKQRNMANIVLAVPVAPPDIVAELAKEVTAVVCPVQPESFQAVGLYYEDFSQTTDRQVTDILETVRTL